MNTGRSCRVHTKGGGTAYERGSQHIHEEELAIPQVTVHSEGCRTRRGPQQNRVLQHTRGVTENIGRGGYSTQHTRGATAHEGGVDGAHGVSTHGGLHYIRGVCCPPCWRFFLGTGRTPEGGAQTRVGRCNTRRGGYSTPRGGYSTPQGTEKPRTRIALSFSGITGGHS